MNLNALPTQDHFWFWFGVIMHRYIVMIILLASTVQVSNSFWFVWKTADISLQWQVSVIASQITCDQTICLAVCSSYQQRKYQGSASMSLCTGNPTVTGGFSSQRASDAAFCMQWNYHIGPLFCKPIVFDSPLYARVFCEFKLSFALYTNQCCALWYTALYWTPLYWEPSPLALRVH